MKRLRSSIKLSVLCLALTSTALHADTRLIDSNKAFAAMLDRYDEEYLELHPIEASFRGDHRFDDRLPNPLDLNYQEQLKQFYTEFQTEAQRFKKETLSKEEQLSQDLLLWECGVHLEQLEFPTYLLPLNQFESFHLTIGQLAAGGGAQPFETFLDYSNWLKRLEQFHPWPAMAMDAMKQGIQEGHVLPRALVKKVIPQINALSRRPVEKHLFFTPIQNLPETFSEPEKKQLTQDYREILDRKIIPAFEDLGRFLRTTYLANSRNTSGIFALPHGKEYYAHQIKIYTTTTMTPEEIFQLGRDEVERLTREMEGVKKQLNFKGSLKAFFEHVRQAPLLTPYTDPQEVIAHFNAIHEKMKPQVARLFRLTPKTAFEVRRTEAFREASSSAEYRPGSLDGTRPGVFFVPIPNVREYNIFSDEDLFLHEAIPGHHYQISLQQENDALPTFRRPLWYSSYGEGWALYCESLGKELGLYQNPYQYFGMLSAEMHRAIRLVVDVGMHAKGWSREKAIQYSLDHEAEPEAGIISEIERYMSWPGQALSYKIGQLKIRELRSRAEKELGTHFDVRSFHDEVLESGCLPLTILEQKINQWIETTKMP